MFAARITAMVSAVSDSTTSVRAPTEAPGDGGRLEQPLPGLGEGGESGDLLEGLREPLAAAPEPGLCLRWLRHLLSCHQAVHSLGCSR